MPPLSRPGRVPRLRSRACATTAFLTAVALFPGCASLGTGRSDADALLATLFPPGGSAATLRGAAEITLSLAGGSISMPGALLLGGSGTFRIDLLDPLDRPAAIIFAEGRRIIQYRPAAREASALEALPGACRFLLPDGWVPFALGASPAREGEGEFQAVSWFGGDSLVKYEWGTVAVRIEYRRDEGGDTPSRVSWYCGDEIAMRLRYGEREGGEGSIPRSFTVEYPMARLEMRVRLEEHETGVFLPKTIFRPRLPAGTRWRAWNLAGEERGGME